jgi:hypothetical protein
LPFYAFRIFRGHHAFRFFRRQDNFLQAAIANQQRCIKVTLSLSQSGGIGRRAAFRSQCPQGREGSNPFSGTTFIAFLDSARVAELADALRSGRSVRKDVKVQILSLVPLCSSVQFWAVFFYQFSPVIQAD